MSDQPEDETLTKPKKQRSEKQIAATERMREALAKKKEDAKPAAEQPKKNQPSKKEILRLLKAKLNESHQAELAKNESDYDTDDTIPPPETKPQEPAPAPAKEKKQKKPPKVIEESESSSEEEVIVVKKKKKPKKKKTIIIQESSSESESEEEPEPVKKHKPPTRETRSQQNKHAKIGHTTVKKDPIHFFMD